MKKIEIAVVGCGPAGLCAAIEAAKYGAEVTLFDENFKPGGQLFKQIHRFFGSEEHLAGVRGFDIGNILLKRAKTYNVDIRLNNIVWGLFPDKKLGIYDNNKVNILEAEKIIVATGAQENSLSFPGWTLPNVMGAGAAQTMININRILPGKKAVIIGSGNVGLILSYQLIQAGAEVVAVIEALPNIGGYQVHASKIARMGVPILLRHSIYKVTGKDSVEKVNVGKVDKDFNIINDSIFSLDADLVCVAVGLRPLAELCFMVKMKKIYIPNLGGFIPIHNEVMETNIPGIYVAGDVTGIEEASTAMEEGKIAGLDAAIKLGKLDTFKGSKLISESRTVLESLRLGPFGDDRRLAKEKIINTFHNYN